MSVIRQTDITVWEGNWLLAIKFDWFRRDNWGQIKQAYMLTIVHRQVAALEALSIRACLLNMNNPYNLGHRDLNAVWLVGPDL